MRKMKIVLAMVLALISCFVLTGCMNSYSYEDIGDGSGSVYIRFTSIRGSETIAKVKTIAFNNDTVDLYSVSENGTETLVKSTPANEALKPTSSDIDDSMEFKYAYSNLPAGNYRLHWDDLHIIGYDADGAVVDSEGVNDWMNNLENPDYVDFTVDNDVPTGDGANLVLWVALLAAGTIGLVSMKKRARA